MRKRIEAEYTDIEYGWKKYHVSIQTADVNVLKIFAKYMNSFDKEVKNDKKKSSV